MSSRLNRYSLLAVILIGAAVLGYSLVFGTPKGESPVRISNADRTSELNVTNSAEAENTDVKFLESTSCALCHSNSDRAVAMRDNKDRPIAPYDLWQASMMANSSRDPFWRAVLSAEVVATPSRQALIEEKCTRCHAPMAAPAPKSPTGEVLAYLKNEDPRSHLGLDGVSCTVCHQITDKGLGNEESFTGNFEINSERKIFGPHADPFPMPMQRHVGYTPTHSNHILKSGLCATCHTVMTNSVDGDGRPTSSHQFHEQTPYLEWRNSVFNDEIDKPAKEAKSCQACHMPTTDDEGNTISTRLAHNPGGRDFPFLKPRKPFGRHTFLGGNTLMKRILRDNRQELDVVASKAAFNQSIKHTLTFLESDSARISIDKVSKHNNVLTIPVSVQNLSGHKLPTAYPSRRVWIQLTVTNEEGNTVFASGKFNDNGELVDPSDRVLSIELADGPVNKHKETVSNSAQVQVYEAIMADAEGEPTFTLLRGATYIKDNRLLPRGWQSDHPDGKRTRPFGIGTDTNFTDGNDEVNYEVPISGQGEFTVTAKLLFQVISPRYANELFKFETDEVKRFRKMFDQANRKPEVLATVVRKFDVE